jgi:hypothetical protein
MAAPTKEQISNRKELEKIIKRDNPYYVGLEKHCQKFSIEMNDQCFIPYALYRSFFIRETWDNTKILHMITHPRPRFLSFGYHLSYYPILEFLLNHKSGIEHNGFFVDYNIDECKEAVQQYFSGNTELSKLEFNMPVITSINPSHEYHKRALIEIDFTKPKKEIMLLVSKLKDEYDSNNNFIQGLDEYLGLVPKKEAYNCTLENCDFYKKSPRKPLLNKLMDAFFIYDCKRIGLTNNYVIDEINRYWNEVKNIHHDKMSEKTYYEYLKYMRNQIDEKQYKKFYSSINQ